MWTSSRWATCDPLPGPKPGDSGRSLRLDSRFKPWPHPRSTARRPRRCCRPGREQLGTWGRPGPKRPTRSIRIGVLALQHAHDTDQPTPRIGCPGQYADRQTPYALDCRYAALQQSGQNPRPARVNMQLNTCDPRACGGGPILTAVAWCMAMWSPRMRGWSQGDQQAPVGGEVVPAHAGVVPPRRARPARSAGGPRACGGGPTPTERALSRRRWSPRMRGWSHRRQADVLEHGVVPAHAGVVPGQVADDRDHADGPRTCGGGPAGTVAGTAMYGWSPHMRGWSLWESVVVEVDVVVPAHAGVVPGSARPGCPSRRGLRTCGGGPRAVRSARLVTVRSPHMRGWPPRPDRQGPPGRVVPAHAGVAPRPDGPGTRGGGGPRACGGGPAEDLLETFQE